MDCKMCGGSVWVWLGRLGTLAWLRCRQCGCEVSVPQDAMSFDEEDA